MRYRWVVYLGFLALVGCKARPYHICTDNKVALTTPIHAQVTADLSPQRNAGPVVPMVVDDRQASCSSGKVALIDVDGLLVNTNLTGPYSAGENPVALFREKLDAVAADCEVCAVIVRINTPGGGVSASDTMRHELQAFRENTGLPVVAYLMDTATGGGYYLATAADVIYAQPTTVTGGVGVILNLYNVQDTMAQFNVIGEPIKSGEHIDMGTSTRALTPEARGWLQAMADEFHQRFVRAVVQARPQVAADDPTNFDGRVFSASQAAARGLVDQVGYLESALEAAQARAGRGRARLVMFHRKDDPARSPFAMTPNRPLQANWLPLSVPGLERSRLPTFLYLWQVEPTLERLGSP